MNLLLLRGGYPPVAIRPEDRQAYIRALRDQGSDHAEAFDRLLYQGLERSLDLHLSALRQALPGA